MAGWYRQLRKGCQLQIDGPAVIFIESGRPGVTVRAAKATRIEHKKRKRNSLTYQPPKR